MSLGPLRLTASRRGLSTSVGVKGLRVTRTAGGRVRTTASVPGTGLSWTSSSAGGEGAPVAGRRRRGAWYWWVTLLSAGLLAAIPMWHAYLRLRTPRQLKVALSLTGLDVLLFALSSASPDSGPTGAAGALYGAVLIVTLIVAVVSVLAVRPLAYPAEEVAAPEPALPLTTVDDAALAAALAQREQRARSRAIVEQDPSLARDLRIGRPDLHGEYDDGGLVDVNSAPVEVIGQVLGLPPDVAQDVVDARVRFSGFQNVDELLACVVLTEGQTEVVKDRAVALPL